MNLLGKWLTGFVCIMSIVFMVLAIAVNASHRNWRDVVLGPTGLKQQIQDVETVNKQLRDARQRIQADLDREQAARRTALAALQTQLLDLQNDLTQANSQLAAENAKNTELVQLNGARATDLQSKAKEIQDLTQTLRNEREDRDELFTQTLKLTDEMNELRGLVQTVKQRNEQLLTQVTRMEEVLDAKGINVDDPLDGAPPERNGTVLALNRPRKLVELSIGEDDGLRAGHLLDVTRGGRFISRVRVSSTEPDRAVANILSDFSSGIIREGDRVDTTFE